MKKIVASVGMVALGVSGAFAVYTPGLSPTDTSKALSVTATLRGFYDDNYASWPSDTARDTFGFEISPSVRFNLPMEQTYLGLRYIYSARYNEDRDQSLSFTNSFGQVFSHGGPWDQTHQFDFILNHAFSERYTLNAQDRFVIAQEPELLAPNSGGGAYPYRTEGNNVHNAASLALQVELTRLLGIVVSYNNSLWDYEDSGSSFTNPSLSGRLDRMEHAASLDLRWHAHPQTTWVLGYTFGMTDYTSDEYIGWLMPPLMTPSNPLGLYKSDIRDLRSHSIYAGVEHNFLRDVTASIRLGATYLDYVHNEVNSDEWMPYANAQLTYIYAPGSNVRIGVVHTYASTDLIDPDPTKGTITSSQQATTAYGTLTHRLSSLLLGSASIRYQHSAYSGGMSDGQADDLLMAGVNLTYAINPHWSVEIGYDYDVLDSNAVSRWDYSRNRVYLGVSASY